MKKYCLLQFKRVLRYIPWGMCVVLVLFGDHKPWAGNAESAYAAAGVSFDVSTVEGFYNYYATP
jgi:hypothetical protein